MWKMMLLKNLIKYLIFKALDFKSFKDFIPT